MKHIVIILLLFVCALIKPAIGGEDPFSQQIRLDLWGKDAGEAISQITEKSGVDVRISPNFMRPREFSQYILYLKASQISVRQAIEWLSRAMGCRYRIDGGHSAWLTGSYDWLNENNPEIMIESIGTLVEPGKGLGELRTQVNELVKVHALFQNYSVRIEKPDQKIVAILPKILLERLRQSLLCMTKPGMQIHQPSAETMGSDEMQILKRLRTKVVVYYREQELIDVVRDISLQCGLNIAFDHAPFRKRPMPRITMKMGEISARKAIVALAGKLGFKGFEIYPPDGVWLTVEDRKWSRASSREVLWENLSVKSYYAPSLARAAGSGEVLIHTLLRRACPDVWLDPSTAMVFHKKSGNLIVIAPPYAQKKILSELSVMMRSGGIKK